MKKKMMITLPEEIRERLKKHSKKYGVPMSGIISLALNSYIPEDKVLQKADKPPKEPKPEKPKMQVVSCTNCKTRYDLVANDGCSDCGSKEYFDG